MQTIGILQASMTPQGLYQVISDFLDQQREWRAIFRNNLPITNEPVGPNNPRSSTVWTHPTVRPHPVLGVRSLELYVTAHGMNAKRKAVPSWEMPWGRIETTVLRPCPTPLTHAKLLVFDGCPKGALALLDRLFRDLNASADERTPSQVPRRKRKGKGAPLLAERALAEREAMQKAAKRWVELAQRWGSKERAAKEVGHSRHTLQRWFDEFVVGKKAEK